MNPIRMQQSPLKGHVSLTVEGKKLDVKWHHVVPSKLLASMKEFTRIAFGKTPYFTEISVIDQTKNPLTQKITRVFIKTSDLMRLEKSMSANEKKVKTEQQLKPYINPKAPLFNPQLKERSKSPSERSIDTDPKSVAPSPIDMEISSDAGSLSVKDQDIDELMFAPIEPALSFEEDMKQKNIEARQKLSELCKEDLKEASFAEVMQKITSQNLYKQNPELVDLFVDTSSFNTKENKKMTQVADKPLIPPKKIASVDFEKKYKELIRETPKTLNYSAISPETKSRIFYSTLSFLEQNYGIKMDMGELDHVKMPNDIKAMPSLSRLIEISNKTSSNEEKEIVDLLIDRLKQTYKFAL